MVDGHQTGEFECAMTFAAVGLLLRVNGSQSLLVEVDDASLVMSCQTLHCIVGNGVDVLLTKLFHVANQGGQCLARGEQAAD